MNPSENQDHNQERRQPASRDPFEPALADSLQRAYGTMDIPDGEPAWNRMEYRLAKDLRRRKKIRLFGGAGGAVAACLIVLLLSISFAQQGSALPNWFKVTKKVYNGSTFITIEGNQIKNTSKAKTAPPPEEAYPGELDAPQSSGGFGKDTEMKREGQAVDSFVGGPVLPVAEAEAKLGEKLKLPSYMPDGYPAPTAKLMVNQDGTKFLLENITYRKSGSESIVLTEQRLASDDFSRSSAMFGGDEAVVKDVDVNGNKAVLLFTTRGGTQIEWRDSTTFYHLSGSAALPEEEVLRVARSIK